MGGDRPARVLASEWGTGRGRSVDGGGGPERAARIGWQGGGAGEIDPEAVAVAVAVTAWRDLVERWSAVR
jgi:hypothetical protein